MNEFKCALTSGEVAIQAWGAAEAPVILCLHGWLDNLASFYPLAEILSDRYRVLLMDLPGHGLSAPLPEGGHYYIWQNVETILELIDKLELENVSLLGHSMGGVVASLFAGTFPSKLSKLILLDSLGPFVDEVADTPKQLAKAILDAQKPSSSLRVFPDFNKAIVARKITSPAMTEDALAPIVKRNLKKVEGGYSWITDKRLRAKSKVRMSEDQVKAFFNHIAVPVQVIIAEQGILPKTWVDKRLSYISDVKLSRIVGHHHFHAELDGAEQSATIINEFLEN